MSKKTAAKDRKPLRAQPVREMLVRNNPTDAALDRMLTGNSFEWKDPASAQEHPGAKVVQIASANGKTEVTLAPAPRASRTEVLQNVLHRGMSSAIMDVLVRKALGVEELTPMDKAEMDGLLIGERAVVGLTSFGLPGALSARPDAPWSNLVRQACVEAFEAGKRYHAKVDDEINQAVEDVHIARAERMMASIIKVAMDTFGIERMELLASQIAGAWDDKRQLHISQDVGAKTFIYQLDPKPAVPYSSALAAEVARNGQQALADIQAALSLDLSEPQSGSILFQDSGHVLYSDSDEDRPESICDRNGQVVLGLCKVCNQAEAELESRCPGAPAAPALKPLDAADDLGVL